MFGQEPWSSGYGKRLTFQRSWVRIPAPYTGWTFFTYICCKNCNVCLKRPKNKQKEAGVGPFLKILKWGKDEVHLTVAEAIKEKER